jgi:2,4-dienoyl-CoA reductase-like NADH-dependent reductase (Old Yellow Enzyme family)
MSTLFSPITIGSVTLSNRIVIAPMCQYSAVNGSATDWHMIHLGHLALSGAGLLLIEATAVSPEGRISPSDLGLWSDENEERLARVLHAVRTYSPIALGIQLGHAGRKASTRVPWEGDGVIPEADGGWRTVAPSSIPFRPQAPAPHALDADGLQHVRDSFVAAAQRAARLGFDSIELHGAHGYLLHQFLSPLSNQRDDQYGGTLENRMRFPLEIFDAVRAVFPAGRPVGVRISATDWVDGGWDLEQSVVFAQALDQRECGFIDVSSGGLSPQQRLTVGPNYQVPFADAIKRAVTMPVMAVGLITDAEQAEQIVATGQADMVALARGILYDPRWPWHAAATLGEQVDAPPQYLRSAPHDHKDLFVQPTRVYKPF